MVMVAEEMRETIVWKKVGEMRVRRMTAKMGIGAAGTIADVTIGVEKGTTMSECAYAMCQNSPMPRERCDLSNIRCSLYHCKSSSFVCLAIRICSVPGVLPVIRTQMALNAGGIEG